MENRKLLVSIIKELPSFIKESQNWISIPIEVVFLILAIHQFGVFGVVLFLLTFPIAIILYRLGTIV
jgi:hypothetical protein